MANEARVEYYTDEAGEWRWRVRAENAQIIAVSGEGFTREGDATRAFTAMGGARDEATPIPEDRLMDNTQFAEFVRLELARIQKLVDDKNADYAGLANSAFANFHEEAVALDVSVEKVWHVWVYKHWTAVTSFCKRGSVRSEPIDGRLDDVIGYCLLLKGILREREGPLDPTMGGARDEAGVPK